MRIMQGSVRSEIETFHWDAYWKNVLSVKSSKGNFFLLTKKLSSRSFWRRSYLFDKISKHQKKIPSVPIRRDCKNKFKRISINLWEVYTIYTVTTFYRWRNSQEWNGIDSFLNVLFRCNYIPHALGCVWRFKVHTRTLRISLRKRITISSAKTLPRRSIWR